MKFCYEADDLREIAKLMDNVTAADLGDLTVTGEGYVIERRFTHNVDLKGTDAWATSITFHDEEVHVHGAVTRNGRCLGCGGRE